MEEYAFDEVAEVTAGGSVEAGLRDRLRGMSRLERRGELMRRARQRWQQKNAFARKRVERLGWAQACHVTALEILGYRVNRTPMMLVAEKIPWAEWVQRPSGVTEALACGAGRWVTSGLRPANQPCARLAQYEAWMREVPDWPQILQDYGESLLGDPQGEASDLREGDSIRARRRQMQLKVHREQLALRIMGGALSGPRLDTLVGDGFLPLLAAHYEGAGFPVWFAWFTGDLPDVLHRLLREAGILGPGADVRCHGWGQGIYGLAQDKQLLT